MRTLWLEREIGALAAVAIELPLILLASWVIAAQILRRFSIARRSEAVLMGVLALIQLWTAELALSLALGESLDAFLAGLAAPEALLGVAGQVLFGFFPLFLLLRRS